MRASRLLGILLVLQARGRQTAEALATEFEVSIRTIYRDIDQLSAAGVPVYADSGPGGGYELLDGYRTGLTGLTQAEAEAFGIFANPAVAEDLGLAVFAASARLKIFAALPSAKSSGAQKAAARFHLDVFDWYQRGEKVEHLAALADCVRLDQRARIEYESWTGTGSKVVDPLGLVLKAGRWYCVARYRDRLSIYKVARITRFAALETQFTRPRDFRLAEVSASQLKRFEADLRPARARVRLHRRAFPKLERLGSSAVSSAASAETDADGWADIDLPLETLEYTAHEFLAFGADLIVVEPAALREKMRAVLAAVELVYHL